jgi:hypothetical protein
MEITPEMSGKIIDESHLNFHVTCKAKMINAINKMKQGKDLLDALGGLNFKTDPRWLQNSCGDPSVEALNDIIAELKRVEKRPSRAKVLIPLFEYAVGLYASDLFFRERGAWLINEIIKKRDRFAVCTIPMFADPQNWYPNTRNNTGKGKDGDLYKWENLPNAPTIEEEYKLWYNVDVTQDNLELPQEAREEMIKGNLEWLKKEREKQVAMVADKI